MATQQREQLTKPHGRRKKGKRVSLRELIIVTVILIALVVAIIWILSSLSIIPNTWAAISSITVAVLGTLFAFLQSLHLFLPPNTHETSGIPEHPLQPAPPQIPPIILQLPVTQPLSIQSVPVNKVPYRGIVGLPPPTDQRTIQQRKNVVKEIYTRITQPDITAIALTGIGGVGKSTLAALVYHFAEEKRLRQNGPFSAEALWLTVDPTVTFADLAGNVFEALGKSLPDLSNLSPQNQSVTLFNALNLTEKPRLLILDQFENLLDWETGHALVGRPGVGEWLDIINSQQCLCRILLTSRPRPVGTREFPLTYLQEYAVKGLEAAEGAELLQNQGVTGTQEELQLAVARCAGHTFSLMLLASLIRDHNTSLAALLKDPTLWTGDIAANLLDQIYMQHLNEVQRQVLLAFSVYRKPVPIDAAQAIVTNVSKTEMLHALKALRVQHLLEAVGEGLYQLHAIIHEYAQCHFDETNEQVNGKALQIAHREAAHYYLLRAKTTCLLRGQRRRTSDVQDLVEAVWQYCQAEMWQEAYDLMEQEGLFADFSVLGGNATLLELYRLLIDNWNPQPQQAVHICNDLGWICTGLGQKEEALRYYEQALNICRDLGDRKEEGKTLTNLGWVHSELGRLGQAQKYLEQALNVETGNKLERGRTLVNLGRVYNGLGQKERARECFEEGLHIYRDAGELTGEGWTLNNLGKLYYDLGQKETAIGYFEQSLSRYRRTGNRSGAGRTLKNLGGVYSELGKKEQGLQNLDEALSILKEVGDPNGAAMTLNNLGMLYDSLGEVEQALKCYEEALSICLKVGDRGGEGWAHNNLGRIYARLKEPIEALKHYKQALLLRREVEERGEEGETLYDLGKLHLTENRYKSALACLIVAKGIFEEVQSPLCDEVQRWIEKIHEITGDERFIVLVAEVKSQTQHIVEQMLNEDAK